MLSSGFSHSDLLRELTFIFDKEVIDNPLKVEEAVWTEMREEYEKVEIVPVEDVFRSVSEKPISRISYAHEKDLVEKEFQEQFNSTQRSNYLCKT